MYTFKNLQMFDASARQTKSNYKKILCLFLSAILALSLGSALIACTSTQSGNKNSAQTVNLSNSSNTFEYWNQDAQSLKALTEYVEDVTNPASENYIEDEYRIAVFDVDGTLYGELAPIYVEWNMYVYRVLNDPTYKCDNPDMIRLANEIIEAGKTKNIPENIEKEHANYAQIAFAGMTIQEYWDYVYDYMQQPAEGFNNATYADMWYLPMINVIDYLNANNFKVYAVSGTDRYMVRAMIDYKDINIHSENVIGMDCKFSVAGKENQDLLDYQLTLNDKIVRGDKLLVKNVKMNKAAQITREIGKKPVLCFGNSSGDISMATLTVKENPRKSAVFMLVADDTERDWANADKAKESKAKWEKNGWNTISMKDDFATIYDTKVEKAN